MLEWFIYLTCLFSKLNTTLWICYEHAYIICYNPYFWSYSNLNVVKSIHKLVNTFYTECTTRHISIKLSSQWFIYQNPYDVHVLSQNILKSFTKYILSCTFWNVYFFNMMLFTQNTIEAKTLINENFTFSAVVLCFPELGVFCLTFSICFE